MVERHDVSNTKISSLGAVSGDMQASPIASFGFNAPAASPAASPTQQPTLSSPAAF